MISDLLAGGLCESLRVGLPTLYIDLHLLTLNDLPAEKMVAKSRRANYGAMQMLKGVKVEV